LRNHLPGIRDDVDTILEQTRDCESTVLFVSSSTIYVNNGLWLFDDETRSETWTLVVWLTKQRAGNCIDKASRIKRGRSTLKSLLTDSHYCKIDTACYSITTMGPRLEPHFLLSRINDVSRFSANSIRDIPKHSLSLLLFHLCFLNPNLNFPTKFLA